VNYPSHLAPLKHAFGAQERDVYSSPPSLERYRLLDVAAPLPRGEKIFKQSQAKTSRPYGNRLNVNP